MALVTVLSLIVVPTVVAQEDDPPYIYDPTSVSLSLYAGGEASFGVDIAIAWGGVTNKRAVSTAIGVKAVGPADAADSFIFDINPGTFILGIDETKTVTVTVSVKPEAAEGTYTCKIVADDLDDGTPVVGEGNGCHIDIIVSETPTPTTTPTQTPIPTPEGNGGGGCFIATAAYGTSTAQQLDVLRAFKDQVLLESILGPQFVAWYYQVSPPVAEFISGSSLLKTVVRELLIDPMVSIVTFTQGIWGD